MHGGPACGASLGDAAQVGSLGAGGAGLSWAACIKTEWGARVCRPGEERLGKPSFPGGGREAEAHWEGPGWVCGLLPPLLKSASLMSDAFKKKRLLSLSKGNKNPTWV